MQWAQNIRLEIEQQNDINPHMIQHIIDDQIYNHLHEVSDIKMIDADVNEEMRVLQNKLELLMKQKEVLFSSKQYQLIMTHTSENKRFFTQKFSSKIIGSNRYAYVLSKYTPYDIVRMRG